MFNVKSILMCPECKVQLSDNLKCDICNHIYEFKHGVYNVISINLSDISEFLWRELDETGMPIIDGNPWDTSYYYKRLNKETLEGIEKQNEYMKKLINNFSGTVCDLATGGGTMLQKLLASDNKAFKIVCTDINNHQLMLTREHYKINDDRVFYVATDGRYMSIQNESFDYITSLSGFGNIPEAEKVAKEMYRTLKPGGKIVLQDTFIEKDSRSYELAQSVGVERGSVEEYLIEDLEKAGFKNIVSTVVAQAIWAENEYDLIPATGDMQYFAVIQAECLL